MQRALAAVCGRPVEARSLRRADRSLAGIAAGEGATVLMCAGAGETVLTWGPLLAALVERGRVVAYDRAGLGASSPRRRSTAQDAVDDLAAVLADVGPAVVVGHSWGGLLAEVLALVRPDLVRGLVLVDPTHEDVFDSVPRRLRLAESLMLRGIVLRHRLGRAGPVVTAMAHAYAADCTPDPLTRQALVEAYVASYSSSAQLATIGHENRLASRCGPWVRPIRAAHRFPDVPITVLTAGDKPLAPLSRSLNETVAPGSEHVFVAESGHYVHRDRPDVVLAALDGVLGRASR